MRMISTRVTQKPSVEQLQIMGEFSGTVFPRLAHRLENSESAIEALAWVSRTKKVDRYECVLDFFLCEFFREYRTACFRYYDNPKKCPQLRDMVSEERVEELENVLLSALSYASLLQQTCESVTWSQFVGQAKRYHKTIWEKWDYFWNRILTS